MYGPDRVVAKVGDVRTKENLLTGRRPYKATAEIQIHSINVTPAEPEKQTKQTVDIQSTLQIGSRETKKSYQTFNYIESLKTN